MVRSPSGSSRSRLQTSARPPAPDSRITVGLPSPGHSRYRFRPPMSTRPEKSPRAAEGDADGVADWAKPEIGTASIRMIRAMTGIRCIAILLLCSQLRQPTGISSDGWALHVLQKPDVRPVRHPRPRHRLAQIVGVGEQACPLEVVPRQQKQDLMRVVGVAEEPSPL